MLNHGQLLIEVLIGILIISFLSLIVFLIFNIIPQSLKFSEESLMIYNRALNYQNILLGLTRSKFSQFNDLLINQPYYLSATSNGYEIKTGKEIIDNNYFQWFEIDNNKLIKVYFQTPNNLYSFNFQLINTVEKIFSQDRWEVATDTIIDLTVTTQTNYYWYKSNNIEVNGQIQLSE